MYVFALAAAAMAFYFVTAALRQPRSAGILAAVLWTAYSVYEYFVANGTLCDPYCNIRVDLLLFLPLLGIATYLALKKRPSPSAVVSLIVICLGLVALLASAFGKVAVAVLAGVAGLLVFGFAVKSRLGRKAT